MRDDLRPRGTVEVACRLCGWHYWLDPLDPQLPGGPFECIECAQQVDECPQGVQWRKAPESKS